MSVQLPQHSRHASGDGLGREVARLSSIAPTAEPAGWALGLMGGQLLALAIGGCFCNDLQYVAHDMGVRLASIEVDVMVAFEGSPLLATQASMHVAVTAADKSADVDGVIRRAKEISSVSNSVRRGVPIHIVGG